VRVVDVIHLSSSANTLLRERVLGLRRAGVDNRILCAEGPYVDALREAGIPVETVPLPRGLNPLQLSASLARIALYLRRNHVDVVHTHCSVPGVVGRVAARLAGVPVVVHTVHGFYFEERLSRVARALAIAAEWICGRITNVLLTQNRSDLASAERYGIGPRDARGRIGNGIDLARFQGEAPRGADTGAAAVAALAHPPTITCVARLEPVKNHGMLFEAVAQLLPRHPDLVVNLVGDGPLRADAEWRCRALGIDGAVRFLGYRDDVPALLEETDVAVLTSEKEGIPRAVLEAMAAAVPVVATDVPGTREALKDGVTGIAVPYGDARALAEAVDRLLCDPELRARMGAAGRQVARTEFDERPITQRLLTVYSSALRKHARGRTHADNSANEAIAAAVNGTADMNGTAEATSPEPEVDADARGGAVRVGRNFVYRILAQAASALVNVGAMVMLGRALEAEGYGRYAYYYALIPLLAGFTELGIGIVLTREIAKHPAEGRRLLGDALLLRLAIAIPVWLAAALVVPSFMAPGLAALVLIVVTASLMDFSQDLSVWVLRAHERLDLEARLLMTSQLVWVGIIALALALHAGLAWLLGAAAVAYAVRMAAGAWIVLRRFGRPVFDFDPRRLGRTLLSGLPFGLAAFLIVFYGRVAVLVLAAMTTPVDVSNYHVGYMLSQPFGFVAAALCMAMFPNLSRQAAREDSKMRSTLAHVVKCQFMMALPVTLALFLGAAPLVALLFGGRGFGGAPQALRILSLALAVTFMNSVARYVLAALDQRWGYFKSVVVGVAVNGGLCLLLVPRFGYVGACVAMLCAETAILLACLPALSRQIGLNEILIQAWKPFQAATVAALWVLALPEAPAAFVVVGSLATYVLMLRVVGAITPDDLALLRRVAGSFSPRGANGGAAAAAFRGGRP
jgi:O-antigen/teichoic acid export membrane protein/glycosyltransferase involved in cell wall biosynthesis